MEPGAGMTEPLQLASAGRAYEAYRAAAQLGHAFYALWCAAFTFALALFRLGAPVLFLPLAAFRSLSLERQALVVLVSAVLFFLLRLVARGVPQRCFRAGRRRMRKLTTRMHEAWGRLRRLRSILLLPILLVAPARLSLPSGAFRLILALATQGVAVMLSLTAIVEASIEAGGAGGSAGSALSPGGSAGGRHASRSGSRFRHKSANSICLWLCYFTAGFTADLWFNWACFFLRPLIANRSLHGRFGWLAVAAEKGRSAALPSAGEWTSAALEIGYGIVFAALSLLVLMGRSRHLVYLHNALFQAVRRSLHSIFGIDIFGCSTGLMPARGEDDAAVAALPFLWRQLNRSLPTNIMYLMHWAALLPHVIILFLPTLLLPAAHFFVNKLWPFVAAVRSLQPSGVGGRDGQTALADRIYWLNFYCFSCGWDVFWTTLQSRWTFLQRLPWLRRRIDILAGIGVQVACLTKPHLVAEWFGHLAEPGVSMEGGKAGGRKHGRSATLGRGPDGAGSGRSADSSADDRPLPAASIPFLKQEPQSPESPPTPRGRGPKAVPLWRLPTDGGAREPTESTAVGGGSGGSAAQRRPSDAVRRRRARAA